MPSDVRPYLVPLPGTVVWEELLLADGATWNPLPEALGDWDSGTDLELRRRVRVDVEQLQAQTGLAPSWLVLTMSWTSLPSHMTGFAPPVPLSASGAALVEARISGDRVSGRLEVRTTLSLSRPPETPSAGSAATPGSVLAEDVRSVLLESTGSMFPIDAVDFGKTTLPRDASWHLETSGDPLAPFFGSFRLLINKRDAELTSAVVRGPKDPRQEALAEDLEAQVAALILELAVQAEEEVLERDDWPDESVGAVLRRTLEASVLSNSAPPTWQELSLFRTRVAGAIRSQGRGRIFE